MRLKTGRLIALIIGMSLLMPISARAEVDTSVVETHLEDPKEAAIVKKGLELVGVPYLYGGKAKEVNEIPDGIDCSGVISYIYTGIEGNEDLVKIYDSSLAFTTGLTEVEFEDLQIGDICYVHQRGIRPNHVGLFIGKNKETGNNLYLAASSKAGRVIVTEYSEFTHYYRVQR